MTTLRVLLAAPIAADHPAHWALYDATGICAGTGHDDATRWPSADRLEIIVAASQVRLAAVTLPPVPPERVAAAAAYALEDRLAGPIDEHWLAASPQRADGRVVVAIVARTLLAGLRSHPLLGSASRVVAEPELVASAAGACWCVPDDRTQGDGFVRLGDGSAFAIGPPPTDGTLPPELALILADATRAGVAPPRFCVNATITDDALARWQRVTGIPFVRGTPWSWHAASAAAFAAATSLLQGESALTRPASAGSKARLFAPALAIAVAALALHIVATLGDWAWWRVDALRATQAWRTLAAAAGIAPADAQTPAATRAALFRRYAQQRHAHGMPAPDDALPLLARVAPALAGLPPGALKSATYADGHWTLDLQPTDTAAIRDLDGRLKRAGAPAIVATTAAGTRLRFGAY